MAPYITSTVFRLHPSLYAHVLNVNSGIQKLAYILRHKLYPAVLDKVHARESVVPVAFYHPNNMGPGPGANPVSLSSNVGGSALGTGASPRHFYPTPLSHLGVWAYLALAFVILAVVTVISYMIYMCYHTAGLAVKLKSETGIGAKVGAVKGGWQNLEDPGGEMGGVTVVKGGEGRLTKDRDVGEKVDDYPQKDMIIDHWNEKKASSLKGLGIQLHTSLKSQYDFASYPNESHTPIIPGSPHSTCNDRSLGGTSDHEHEQDLEPSEGSDCPSMSAQPLAHTTERSAIYLPSNVPLPLPPPVTPSHQKQEVKQKRTRLRAFTQILSHKLSRNQQNGREIYFELQPMITTENGVSQSKGLSETLDESGPLSPSPLSSRSNFSPVQFAFFPLYQNSSNSASSFNSNATWGNNGSFSPTAAPITPLTPITPMTPVTPMKPGPTTTAEIQFDSHNIQFVDTPPSCGASPGIGTSPPEMRTTLAAASMTRAEMLWNDPKLSPVQGVPVGLGRTNPTEIVLGKSRTAVPSQLKISTTSVGYTTAPTLATPEQIHRGYAGYLCRGVSLSSSPPSPLPSSYYYSDLSSSNSVPSSPSIVTARFIVNRGELKRDNLRNRVDGRKEKKNLKRLSPIPRPVFLGQPQALG